MRIRNIFKRFSLPRHLLAWMMIAGLYACTTDAFESVQEEPEAPVSYTYSMHLRGTIEDYGESTRAGYQWNDGSKLYVQFFENGERIAGTATLSLTDDVWTVKTSKALTAPDDAYCETYFFATPSATLSSAESFGLETITYADKNGTYTLEEDDAIAVTASLSPLTGRIRFVGTPGKQYTISGLMTYAGYNTGNNILTVSARKLSVNIGDNGSSDYYYALFENEHRLVIHGEGKAAYMRTFAEGVLTAGSSGFVTLPMDEDSDKWILVNSDNLEKIELPEVSAVAVSTIRSKSAGVTANVTSKGNGTLLESGILCSANSTPTSENSTKYDAEKSMSISLRVKNLTPMSTYYVRAYARNERGIVYGEVAEFTTLSDENEGPSFSIEDYEQEDDDLNSSTGNGDNEFGREEHEEDDDLDSSTDSDDSEFNKEEHDEDDNLNEDTESDNSSFGKEEYEDDDNLNSNTDSDGDLNKGDYGDDEDYNTGTDSDGDLNKGNYGDDEDYNTDTDSAGGLNKDDYGNDEDYNTGTDSSGGLNKDNYNGDEDWN